LADNRSAHYYLGFDKNSFTARGNLSNSFSHGRNAGRLMSSTQNGKSNTNLTGADIAGA